jgi:hypothetical protein
MGQEEVVTRLNKEISSTITYFITEELPPHFRWDPSCPIRGTDRFYVRTAEEATSLGREVVVVYDGPTREVNRVVYKNRSQHDRSCPDAAEVWLMNPRSNLDIVGHTGSVRIWTNFFFDHPDYYFDWLDSVDVITDDLVVISSAAKNLMPPNLGARVVPHGIDHALYSPTSNKIRKRQVAFTSSPDRGLAKLQALWDRCDIEQETGYRLVTGTYGDRATSDQQVRDLLAESDFWVHPGVGRELFSLAAAEAQAAGCTPIVVPSGGLATTVRHGYRFTSSSFEEGLLAVLSGQATMQGVTADHIPSWRTATAALLGWDSLLI